MSGISFPLGSGTNRWKVIGPDGVETTLTMPDGTVQVWDVRQLP